MLSLPETDTGPGATSGTRQEPGNQRLTWVSGTDSRSVGQGGRAIGARRCGRARPLHLIHGGASSYIAGHASCWPAPTRGRLRQAAAAGRAPPTGRDVVLSRQYPAIQLPTQPAAGHATGNRPPTRRYPGSPQARPGQAGDCAGPSVPARAAGRVSPVTARDGSAGPRPSRPGSRHQGRSRAGRSGAGSRPRGWRHSPRSTSR